MPGDLQLSLHPETEALQADGELCLCDMGLGGPGRFLLDAPVAPGELLPLRLLRLSKEEPSGFLPGGSERGKRSWPGQRGGRHSFIHP